MFNNFNFIVVRNCELAEKNKLLLGSGKSTFRIDVPPAESLGKDPFCYILFDLEAVTPFSGVIAELHISWQDVPIARLEIGAFGVQRQRIPVKSFKTPSTFDFDIKFKDSESIYRGEFEDFSPQRALLLSNFRVESHADELGARASLISAGRRLSHELGLIDDYLSGPKYEATLNAIVGALKNRNGFSLIRLGDGEGRVLGYPDHFSDQEVLVQLLHYHFGPDSMQLVKIASPESWIATAMQFLRDKLTRSIKNADILGLPPNTHFPTDAARDAFGMLGFACAIIYGLSLSKLLPKSSYVGTDVFQLGAAKGLFFRDIIRLPRKIYLVGPWDLRRELGVALGRDDFRFIRVPRHHTWGGRQGLGQYPDLFRFVESHITLEAPHEGCLFLVGAGLFGKHYCNLVKLQGGVALDIGSVFDSWARKGLPYAVSNQGIDISTL